MSWTSRDGSVRFGILDALVREPDGSLWILDYKTDEVPTAERETGALTALATARHGEQLTRYAEGVRAALALDAPPSARVWFARHDALVEIDGASG